MLKTILIGLFALAAFYAACTLVTVGLRHDVTSLSYRVDGVEARIGRVESSIQELDRKFNQLAIQVKTR